jgi:hypothetical protein
MKTERSKRRKANETTPAGAIPVGAAQPLERQETGGAGTGNHASPELVTEVAAKLDVGWGNALFIRGQGDGLSWDKGTPLACADSSTWVWSTRRAKGRVVFKLLLNDQVWADGSDYFVEAGQHLEIVPAFQPTAG